jgi:hypothetical protein
LDHAANQAAGAVANYFVPGSGPYVTQGLEYRDMYNRGQWQPPQAMYAPMPRYGQPFYGQPAYAPMPQPPYAQPFYGQPMYAPVLRPMYAPAMPPYIVR